MDTRIKRAGFIAGIAGIVVIGYLGVSGQYIASPTIVATSGGGLTVTSPNSVGLTTSCSAGERLEWDGTAWQCRTINDYRSASLEWQHEFITAVVADEYSTAQTGTGATFTTIDGQGRPGVGVLSTGTTTTGLSRIFHSGFAFSLSSLSSYYFQAVVGVPTLSTGTEEYTVEYGCRDNSGTVDQTNGCYLLYDRGNVAAGGCNTGNANKWAAFCANNGTRTRVILDGTSQDGACGAGAITTVDSSVAAATLPNTNIYNLEIVGTPSSVAFKINGTTRATITTNIPSTLGRYCADSLAILKSAGTTNRDTYSDRIAAKITLPAARNP